MSASSSHYSDERKKDGSSSFLNGDLMGLASFICSGQHTAVDEANFYRSLLDRQHQYVILLDCEGIVHYCNQRYADFLEMPLEKITGIHFAANILEDDLPDVQEKIDKFRRIQQDGAHIWLEYRTKKAGGNIQWQQWEYCALFEGGVKRGYLCTGQDIEREVYAGLPCSEGDESYALLFQYTLDAILFFSEAGRILALNSAASQIFGYEPQELVDCYWQKIVDVSDPHLQDVIRDWRRSEVYKGEFVMLRKNGEKFPAEISSVSFYEKSGKRRISLVVRDISSRRKTEEQLQQVYDRLSYHINNSPLAVIEWDEDSRLKFWSEGAERLFGWKAEEVVGTLWHEWNFTHVDDRQLVGSTAQDLRNGLSKSNVLVNRNITRDGKVITCRWHNTVMKYKNGESISVLSLVQDITRQSETEKALLESEERYRCLFQNNYSVMLLLDSENGAVLDSNAAASKFYGYSREELLDMNIADFYPVDSRDAPQELLQSGRSDQENFFYRHRLRNGDERNVEIFSGPVNIGGKHLLYAIIHDVTERVKVEEALHHQMYENARLLSEASRQAQDRQDILHLSSLLRVAERRTEVYPILIEAVTEMLRAQAGVLALLENKVLNVVSGYGKWHGTDHMQFMVEEDSIWNAILAGKIECYPSLMAFEEIHHIDLSYMNPSNNGIESLAMIPVHVGKTIIGLFLMGYQTDEDFKLMHEALAREISDIAGITLHRLQVVESLETLVADRTRELDTLYNITSVARKTLNLKTSMEGALDQIQKVMDNLAGAIYLIDEYSLDLELVIQQDVPQEILEMFSQIEAEKHPNVWVLKHGETLFLPDIAGNSRFPMPQKFRNRYAFLSEPLRVGGQVVGVLNVFRNIERAFNLDEMTLISAIADHLGLIVENMRLNKQAEQAAIMEERARLARDLHDSATQYLYSITLYTEAGRALFEKGDYQQVRHYIQRLAEISHQALKEIRLLVYELRPPALDEDGIIGALKKRLDAVEERARVNATLVSESVVVLPRDIEEGLYKIALEALNNALKHAEASEVKVNIRQQQNQVILTIEDNGNGFEIAQSVQKGGMGLMNMRERAENLGGTLEIKTNNSGTTVSALIPISEER